MAHDATVQTGDLPPGPTYVEQVQAKIDGLENKIDKQGDQLAQSKAALKEAKGAEMKWAKEQDELRAQQEAAAAAEED